VWVLKSLTTKPAPRLMVILKARCSRKGGIELA
jgi:hypothetical protein